MPSPAARARTRLAYLLVAPAMLWLLATPGWPLISAIILSLRDIKVIGSDGGFVGADNYVAVLSQAPFWRAMLRSAVWVVANAFVQTALALGAALILNQTFPGVRIARTWIIITWIVPTVVVVIIWRWLLSTSGGMINPLLIEAGLIRRPIGFFSTPDGAMASLVLINSWRWFPFIAIMLLAGLQRIPTVLYEAAAVDGGTPLQRFRYITWPLLQPTLYVLGVIGILLSFNVFDIIWLMTAGGPSGGTETVPVLIYQTAFKSYRLSQAAAMSVIASLIMMALALLLTRAMAPREAR